jgi:hypothetical protein
VVIGRVPYAVSGGATKLVRIAAAQQRMPPILSPPGLNPAGSVPMFCRWERGVGMDLFAQSQEVASGTYKPAFSSAQDQRPVMTASRPQRIEHPSALLRIPSLASPAERLGFPKWLGKECAVLQNEDLMLPCSDPVALGRAARLAGIGPILLAAGPERALLDVTGLELDELRSKTGLGLQDSRIVHGIISANAESA